VNGGILGSTEDRDGSEPAARLDSPGPPGGTRAAAGGGGVGMLSALGKAMATTTGFEGG